MALRLDVRAWLEPSRSAAALAQAQSVISEAVRRLQAGHLLGLPTETVYGLAADADQPQAVARIFAAKGRPSDHPLIVHVAGAQTERRQAALEHYSCSWPAFAERLMTAFWPGPLTLILPRRSGVAQGAAGGQESIALRCPAHPVAMTLLTACADAGIRGLAAPSANRFGRLSPTTAAHVLDEFQGLLSDEELLVLDGGPCPVGIESAIIDCTRERPVLLRPGMLALSAIEAAAGMELGERDRLTPRAPGTLAAHYAPKAQLRLLTAQEIQSALDELGAAARHLAVYSRTPVSSASAHVRLERMPALAQDCAQELFAVLRALDRHDTRLIWVETPPEGQAWDGVRDRLSRAAVA